MSDTLVERLRREFADFGQRPRGFVNQDGPEAADRIETLEREVKEAEKANRAMAQNGLDLANSWQSRALTAEAREARLREALRKAGVSFETIRLTLIKNLEEPERSAFWEAVHARDAVRAALSGSGSGWRGSYRLLETTDTIQAGDEVIGDDGVTWCPVDRWSIGCGVSRLFKSIRRASPAAPQQGGE